MVRKIILLFGVAAAVQAEGDLFVTREMAAPCREARVPAVRVMEAMGFAGREVIGGEWQASRLTRFVHVTKTENWRQVLARVGPVTVERPASTAGRTAATLVLEDRARPGGWGCQAYLIIEWAGYAAREGKPPVWRWMESNGRMEEQILELVENEVKARKFNPGAKNLP